MKISAVLVLIAANVAVYLLQLATNGHLELPLALWPLQPFQGEHLFRPWQIITYSFLHDPTGVSHLFFNMLGLWMFGAEIERYVGPARILACYFASVVTAALAQLLMPFITGAPAGATIGASGGVFGLLLAYAVMFPHRKVVPLIPPIPMPAWLFATIYACLELFLGVTGTLSGVAHFAHLGGMVGSALVLMQWRASARKTR
ncbi:MAG TPA: rhomboid family intramembrane serine protease [Steroidobacteraceae bacterium]|jgi:membrane associated rhomboid family serine protease|nr:rhomboid family intramembrane serine protease [Steroidobacteraceae bacterium]